MKILYYAKEERKKNYEENKNVKQFCLSSYENIIKFYYLLDNPSESEVRQSCCQEFQYLFSRYFYVVLLHKKKTVNISVIRVSFEKHPLSSILYVHMAHINALKSIYTSTYLQIFTIVTNQTFLLYEHFYYFFFLFSKICHQNYILWILSLKYRRGKKSLGKAFSIILKQQIFAYLHFVQILDICNDM